MHSYNIRLPHTFVADFDMLYTCMNNGHSDPTQIDYMATTAPERWITDAELADSSATSSDHWPLALTLLRKSSVRARPRAEEEA